MYMYTIYVHTCMWGVSLNNAIDVLGPTDKLDKPPLEEVIVISWNTAIPLTLLS